MKTVKVNDSIRDFGFDLVVPKSISIEVGDWVVVQGNKKEKILVEVLMGAREADALVGHPDYRFERKISESERKKFLDLQKDNTKKCEQANEIARKAKKKMYFFKAKVGWGGRLVALYFVSNDPVDFREILKPISDVMNHAKVHLQRVDPRKRAAMIGGVGTCGRFDCCEYQDFGPEKVSITSVRDQGVMIKNNEKIYDHSGRLKKCWNFELNNYRENRRYLPHMKQSVVYDGKEVKVIGLDILNLRVRIRFEEGLSETVPVSDIEYPNKRIPPTKKEVEISNDIDIEGVGI